ncbi:unnamed protein product, partial [Symbiodinium sp. CCMP2456]
VPPAFSFGIIADVQYADRDDALNFSGSRLRRYRTSKRLWEGAVQWFREEQVDFIAQLGDFVDGCNRATAGHGHKALQDLLLPLEGGPPTLHLVGNHELYNFPRKEMEEGIALPELSEPYRISAPPVLDPEAPSSTSSYYSFCPSHGWRVCVVDPYEISIMSGGGARPGIDADAELDSYAVELCQANNPNDITKEDFARGIAPGPDLRWVPLNGAVSQKQLQWLEDTLREASDQKQRTILLSHVVLLPEATPRGNGLTLLWNYDEVLDIIRRAADPPVAAMCGHAHLPVYAVDKVCGTHHITLPSPLEVEPGSDACAVVLAHQNGDIEIKGVQCNATQQLNDSRSAHATMPVDSPVRVADGSQSLCVGRSEVRRVSSWLRAPVPGRGDIASCRFSTDLQRRLV